MPAPVDFAVRPLSIEYIDAAALKRIFRTPPGRAIDPLFFGKTSSYRFDAPASPTGPAYGITYAAFDLTTCFAETITRDSNRKPLQFGGIEVNEALEIRPRYATTLNAQTRLRLADLTDLGLYKLGAEAGEFNSLDYPATTQQWGLAIFNRAEQVDGILYRSRLLNRRLAVAIFDRAAVRTSLFASGIVSLDNHPDYPSALKELGVYLS
jgi:hypothetical protein